MAILKSYYRYPIKCSETVTVVFYFYCVCFFIPLSLSWDAQSKLCRSAFFNHSSAIFSLHTHAAT